MPDQPDYPPIIDDLRFELERVGEALIERLRPELQALHQEMSGLRTELQHAFRSPSLQRSEPSEAEIATTELYSWFIDPAAGVWHISVPPDPTRVFHIADCVGLAYIQAVLRVYPNELSPSQVQVLAGNGTAISPFARGPQLADLCVDDVEQENRMCPHYENLQLPLDKRAKREVCERLRSICEEIETAERNNDLAQKNSLHFEKEQILEYLDNATGKNNRQRRMSSHEASARDAVRKGIKRAIATIAKVDSNAAEFLNKHIKTGWKVSYIGPEIQWRFHVPDLAWTSKVPKRHEKSRFLK